MTAVLPVFHVEIKMRDHVIINLSVPDLDCVRVPGVYRSSTPQPVKWVAHAIRMWRAEYNAVVGTPDNYAIERFELTARRVS